MVNKAYFTFCTKTGQRHLIDQACDCCNIAVDVGKNSMSKFAARLKAKKLKAKEKKIGETKEVPKDIEMGSTRNYNPESATDDDHLVNKDEEPKKNIEKEDGEENYKC